MTNPYSVPDKFDRDHLKAIQFFVSPEDWIKLHALIPNRGQTPAFMANVFKLLVNHIEKHELKLNQPGNDDRLIAIIYELFAPGSQGDPAP